MKKILLYTVLAALVWTGCSKVEQPTPPPPPPPQDVYAAFKADITPRWENGTLVQKIDAGDYAFVLDNNSSLFSSSKYKVGRISLDGNDYEIIEFNGTPAVGKPTEPSLRKPSGTTALNSLEILKIEGAKLWIVFKETASSTERRIVQ